MQIRRTVDGCINGVWGDDPVGDETDIVVIRVADFDRRDFSVGLEKITLRNVSDDDQRRRSLKPGDLLIEKSGGGEKQQVGQVVRFSHDFPAVTSNFVARMRVRENHDSRYMNYVFASMYSSGINTCSIKQNTGIQNLDSSQYLREKILCPPKVEQTAIVRFLDLETGRINTLIDKQKKLIELLMEKRQAVISQAVTKGIDPDVPMKDSEVKWLGEMPKHWKILALKNVLKIPMTDGPHETPNFLDAGVPFVSAEAISKGFVDFSRVRGYISEADDLRYSAKYKPRQGDVFLVKAGATTGVAAIVTSDKNFNIWSPLAAMRCDPEVNPEFLLRVLRSREFQDSIALHWNYGTQQNIGMGVLENLPVPIPPSSEQKEIISMVEGIERQSANIIAKAELAIELLKERREALITAAVTGQIDVTVCQLSAETATA